MISGWREEAILSEFVVLQSKIYSLVDVDNKEDEKAKGVNKSVVSGLKHKEIVDVLFGGKLMRHKIQIKLHGIGTYDVCKISLSCFDDERYILDVGINSLAYFHKDVRVHGRCKPAIFFQLQQYRY